MEGKVNCCWLPRKAAAHAGAQNSISYSAPNAFRWYIEVYPTLKPEERPLELIQEPGEIIFVPAGWWHTVLNVTDTVAVTQVRGQRGSVASFLFFHTRSCPRTGWIASTSTWAGRICFVTAVR